MCNHYRAEILKGATIPGWSRDQFSEIKIPLRFGNMATDIFPDTPAVIVRLEAGEQTFNDMRWGLPPPPNAKPPRPVTNVRNVKSAHWRPWLKPEFRCVVPATSFFEYDERTRGQKPMTEVEFALPSGDPFYFAGIWRPWSGTRGTKKNPVTGDHLLFSFLTCEPNAIVAPIHPKAMPVILYKQMDIETWLNAPTETALQLQRPLHDDELVVVSPPSGASQGILL